MSPSRIAVLPPALADQIAAGEVVERAASVVKELCENAIDAGAQRVEVEIEGGGRRVVRVVDDGGGMTPEEARLALRRHATSKLRNAEDLWNLATFGFRGEALPSIAAVSRLTLATKRPGADAGFQLTVEAGLETEAREVGIPGGTQIEVRDLFFNTPARQKFQKTEATESANVTEAVLRLALGHPEVHFRLRAGGRTVLDLPAHQRLGERVRAAMARRGAGALHEAVGEEGGHQVQAFLAGPEEASATARSTFLFVGRRFIRDRALLQAVCLGYGELLERGRYPLAALFLDVPGEELDVNVHPQKMEVRFARATEVHAAVRHVIAAGISRAPWLPTGAASGARMHSLPARGDESTFHDERGNGHRDHGNNAAFGASGAGKNPGGHGDEFRLRDGERSRAGGSAGGGASGLDAAFVRSLSYIGQFQRTYLLCETRGELVLVDQHAASELVIGESLRGARDRQALKPQRLLFPVPLQLEPEPPRLSADDLVALERAGFLLDVGRAPSDPLILVAVPEALKDADPKPLLQEVLRLIRPGSVPEDHRDEGSTTGAGNAVTRTVNHVASQPQPRKAVPHDELLAAMACHGAARAGDMLGRPQVLALLEQLAHVDLARPRRHDRPLFVRITVAELEHRFVRDAPHSGH